MTGTITDPQRAVEWEAILGTTTVCLKSCLPYRANLPGLPNRLVYELDLASLDDGQRRRLIDFLARKFTLEPEFVAAKLDEFGVPILAEHVTVQVRTPCCFL